ncbi:hypothetical protein ABT275_03690 [Streptomyces sp. NPDC001185]|uniref:hypothetical protein n=1 Tax=Streptomyces sp. NPDC001185 TaxID=3154380 RepID=UPI003323831F
MDVTASCGVCDRGLEFGYLCPGDTLALAERLERMPKVYEALAGFLAPASTPPGERVSTSGGARLPVNEAALDLRYGGIALVLESWLSDVQDARGWGQPAVGGVVEERVRRAARSLSANLEWIASSYPAAGDLAKEVREMEGAALSIVGAKPDRGRLLGQCVAADASGAVCGAPIRYRGGETKLVCPWCQCVYGDRDFRMLARLQPREDTEKPKEASDV